jgi:Tfp pilus assembly protein PilN
MQGLLAVVVMHQQAQGLLPLPLVVVVVVVVVVLVASGDLVAVRWEHQLLQLHRLQAKQ